MFKKAHRSDLLRYSPLREYHFADNLNHMFADKTAVIGQAKSPDDIRRTMTLPIEITLGKTFA